MKSLEKVASVRHSTLSEPEKRISCCVGASQTATQELIMFDPIRTFFNERTSGEKVLILTGGAIAFFTLGI
jgi:hypothetical protein